MKNSSTYINDAFSPENVQIELSNRNADKNSQEKVVNNSFNSETEKGNLTTPIELVQKEEWGGRLEFLMACISNSVGLGNIWRFPFTALENGGGAFLIPYIIILFLVGKPFYYLEGILGQFTSQSCTKTWNMSPAMKGLGYGQIFVAFCIVSYYCSLMALTVYYLIASFRSILPWSYCRDEWRGHCFDASSNMTNFGNGTFSSSAELYFRKIVLNEMDSIENGLGIPSWSLLLCLLFSWLCMFGIMSRGVKTSGKAVYFLAMFPYVVMIILLIRAVTLSGALNGIVYFVNPKWEELLKPKVWYAAITQCFFSLGVCLSPIISYSSHNNFNHPLSRDIMIITTLDTFTSLMAGCTIFGILGNLAHEMGTNDVSKVVRGGSGLAFISYPDALSRFSVVPQFFSALFFFMMFVLGAGSAVALHTSITDVAIHCCSKQKKWIIILGTCIVGFLSGIIYTTPGGQWFVTLVDYYGGTCIAIIIGVIEIITIFWIYGLYNFLNDAEFMLGIRPGFYWRICWCILTPLLMIVILFYTFATYEPVKYNDLLFPSYAYAIGWCIFAVGVFLIVYFIIREIRKNKDLLLIEAIKNAFEPKNWGPSSSETRGKWNEFKAERKINRKEGFFELFFR